jgi:hypothetical protein
MNPNSLINILKPYKKGWIAINNKRKIVIAHSDTYDEIESKAQGKKDILLIPVSNNYFGFVTITCA